MSPHPGLFGMCGVFALPVPFWGSQAGRKRAGVNTSLEKEAKNCANSDFFRTLQIQQAKTSKKPRNFRLFRLVPTLIPQKHLKTSWIPTFPRLFRLFWNYGREGVRGSQTQECTAGEVGKHRKFRWFFGNKVGISRKSRNLRGLLIQPVHSVSASHTFFSIP